jgi:CRISPR/Cas system CSM-associated protein Csm4 (group 5 of RAMP superfamily)
MAAMTRFDCELKVLGNMVRQIEIDQSSGKISNKDARRLSKTFAKKLEELIDAEDKRNAEINAKRDSEIAALELDIKAYDNIIILKKTFSEDDLIKYVIGVDVD